MFQPLPHLTQKSSTEDRIVYLLFDRDKKALTLIFDRYGSLLLNVILKVVDDRQLAEDVLQHVLIKVWNKGHTYNPERGALFTWLMRISKNAALDQRKTKDFRMTSTSMQAQSVVSISNDFSEESQATRMETEQMISHLSGEHEKLIKMSYFEGYSHAEIAKNLNMPLGTVKSKIRIAIGQLRALV